MIDPAEIGASLPPSRYHLEGNGGTHKGTKDAAIDAAIAGGGAVFAVFVAAPGLPDSIKVWTAFVAFGTTFFASLGAAIRRPHR